jgi:hypothetical protein
MNKLSKENRTAINVIASALIVGTLIVAGSIWLGNKQISSDTDIPKTSLDSDREDSSVQIPVPAISDTAPLQGTESVDTLSAPIKINYSDRMNSLLNNYIKETDKNIKHIESIMSSINYRKNELINATIPVLNFPGGDGFYKTFEDRFVVYYDKFIGDFKERLDYMNNVKAELEKLLIVDSQITESQYLSKSEWLIKTTTIILDGYDDETTELYDFLLLNTKDDLVLVQTKANEFIEIFK